jgi:hypothetical protein
VPTHLEVSSVYLQYILQLYICRTLSSPTCIHLLYQSCLIYILATAPSVDRIVFQPKQGYGTQFTVAKFEKAEDGRATSKPSLMEIHLDTASMP